MNSLANFSMNPVFRYIFILLIPLLWSCDGEQAGQNNSDLPSASTVENEILVVMDSAQWKGPLGEQLREIYTSSIPGLPQQEPAFNLRFISPRHFQGFLKLYPNIILVTTLNDDSRDSRIMRTYFTDNSLEQIRENRDMFMFARENVFARGQEVLHLFSMTEEELLEKLEEKEEALRKYFLDIERQRLSKKLFTGLPNENLTEYLQKKYGFRLIFPIGYEVAIEKDQFVWVRFLDKEIDRSVWVAYKEYEDADVFQKENLIELRNELARPYIWGSDSTTYMKTVTEDVPVVTREVNFNGNYAVEMRGLWRLNGVVMGGPFISYTFVDEATNRLYYIEGFTYAPSTDKREPIRELEAILHTFKSTAPAGEANAEEPAAK
ncbi:DUF4837 family protein [Nafulsella turpanensis]|uniref:DUF4837 family protein n=1 Tax=Nafulsella turpanensis TaxID=1265690 RepID=UPI00034C3021|nr:DUF4837 family protein [Nafulsella turpanensis]